MARQAVLFTPGDEQWMVEKSLMSDADMVILDIEDAVAPTAKDEARKTIRRVLKNVDPGDIEVELSVRINSIDTRGEADLSKIADVSDMIENVVLPKVRGTDDIDDLERLLNDFEFDADIIPLIETPESVRWLFEIGKHPEVTAFEFGAEDYTTKISGVHTDERNEIIYARQKVVAAAAAAGIDAVDMAWTDFDDLEGMRKNTKQAVNLGYDGKSAIHPAQISVIRDVFTPEPEQIDWAERIVARAEEEAECGKVVFELDGEMIDPPIIERAHDILERVE